MRAQPTARALKMLELMNKMLGYDDMTMADLDELVREGLIELELDPVESAELVLRGEFNANDMERIRHEDS